MRKYSGTIHPNGPARRKKRVHLQKNLLKFAENSVERRRKPLASGEKTVPDEKNRQISGTKGASRPVLAVKCGECVFRGVARRVRRPALRWDQDRSPR